MVDPIRREGWAGGINNKAHWRDMPEETVRDSVNFDPLESGSFALRSGAVLMAAGVNIRGALAVGEEILIADGPALKVYDLRTASTTAVASIDAEGLFNGSVLNEELFFCTTSRCYRYRSGLLRPWGVPTVNYQPVPTLTTGGLLPGVYQLAMTWTDSESGEEGGTGSPIMVAVAAGKAVSITLPTLAGYTASLYVSPPDSSTLYRQFTGSGVFTVSVVDDSTARLQTMHLTSPQPFAHSTQLNSVLVMASGRVLWTTEAMRPHLCRPMSNFIQFADDITMVIAANDGVYVSADKTWFISGIEGEEPTLEEVFPFPAVEGTAVALPDGSAAWMTPYGIALSKSEGLAELISRENFVPELADKGSSGIVQNNGNQLVVTTMPGDRKHNPLAASDYYEAEIVLP